MHSSDALEAHYRAAVRANGVDVARVLYPLEVQGEEALYCAERPVKPRVLGGAARNISREHSEQGHSEQGGHQRQQYKQRGRGQKATENARDDADDQIRPESDEAELVDSVAAVHRPPQPHNKP